MSELTRSPRASRFEASGVEVLGGVTLLNDELVVLYHGELGRYALGWEHGAQARPGEEDVFAVHDALGDALRAAARLADELG